MKGEINMQKHINPRLNALLSKNLSELEKVEANCVHGPDTLLRYDDYRSECAVCKAIVNDNMFYDKYPETVDDLLAQLIEIMYTTKYTALNINTVDNSKVLEYFDIIHKLNRFPEIYKEIYHDYQIKCSKERAERRYIHGD